MSPDRLGTALRDLVDDVEEGVAAPVAGDLWAGGRRRRRTALLVPALAAACVAALLALLVWPTGAPQASVPAVNPDDGTGRLTTYPSVIPLPYRLGTTSAPGVTAAFVPVYDTSDGYAVSPAGVVTELRMPPDESGLAATPALSPDGRWLAQGPVLINLTTGRMAASDGLPLVPGSQPPPSPQSWWSPDSRRLFHQGVNVVAPRSFGVVRGVDGSTTEVPTSASGTPLVAGWLDDQTLFALVGADDGAGLRGATWRLGDAAWALNGAAIPWMSGGSTGPGSSEAVRAALSPDRDRLLLTLRVEDSDNDARASTRAMMFDRVTGAQLGMPVGDEGELRTGGEGAFVQWDGWGCRPAWRNNLPVVTDGRVRGFVDTDPNGVIDGAVDTELVSVSGRYDDPCVAFAGDELRGTPVADTSAIWQERAFEWGGRLLIIGILVGGGWWVRRQRRWARPDSSQRPIVPGRA